MRNELLKCTLIIISITILFYHIVHLFSLWSEVPRTIPIHFSKGEPDQWGSKYLLFIMPVVSILIWFFMGLLAKRPEKLNYVNLTEENKHRQYVKAEKGMVVIQYLSLMIFEFANEAFLRNAVGMDSSLPFSIALALMAICFLAPIYHLFWAARLKK
ncbi:DUF1648 domain-containing protein [Rossellomorea sp. SC111]|uniref:DUF1648 domain-containing protein n=1 Tax=Rossellomorea sp. SC111 TaxID=2968985 RepID=UPI00215A15D1|nr:DUF1648 domain-containing protein [Rossellomorea sp. SC111]MCR8848060.1 DUF1648 domain-containing protein [Rossellomorea sp. SC111]